MCDGAEEEGTAAAAGVDDTAAVTAAVPADVTAAVTASASSALSRVM